LDALQLEFFPKGREKTSFEGVCSLFLWCPQGTKVKYQLWVGNFLRAPDEDDYTSRIGHGHSNFCPMDPEVDRETDTLRVGVNFLEVMHAEEVTGKGLKLIATPLEQMVAKEVEVIANRNVSKIIWKISKISERLAGLPRGAAMWSKLFTAAGIREILFEFYPNGSNNTTKDGFCAFYVRCQDKVTIVITLIVGKVKKGPIKAVFDTLVGKGLPDFCPVEDQINTDDDTLEVGIELQHTPDRMLLLET